MLIEWLTYLTTPCPRHLRAMGYLREAVGIESRYRRHSRAWAPHLEKSHETIRKAIEMSGGGDTVVVLGAGLVYDLPMDALSAAFKTVQLIDLVHMRPARRTARRYPNVNLVAWDVTESLEAIADGRAEIGKPERYLDDPSISLVISANLLSQLPISPMSYLEKRGMRDEEAEEVGRALIDRHIEYLSRFAVPVCLITDIEREMTALKEGEEWAYVVTALLDAELPWVGQEWFWDIAPRGEVDKTYSVKNRVVGIPDILVAEPSPPSQR